MGPYFLNCRRMFSSRKIDFLIIGAQKSGTSSLYRYLTANLMIDGPQEKELHYFDLFYDRGQRWFHRQFNFRAAVQGEASPYYLLHPQAAERAYRYNSKLKLITILREPMERAWSHYRMNRKRQIEDLSFPEALKAESQRLQQYDADQPDNALQNYSYLERGLYAEQLELWCQYFSPDQILVLNFHDFAKDPWKEVQKVYRFLAVAPFYGHDTYLENRGEMSPMPEIPVEFETYFTKSNQQLKQNFGISFG